MGEIIYSICVGGFLIITGITMYLVLRAEQRNNNSNKGDES